MNLDKPKKNVASHVSKSPKKKVVKKTAKAPAEKIDQE